MHIEKAEKLLTEFLASEKKEEDNRLEAVLKKAEEDAKNKTLTVTAKYDKPVLNFFNIKCLVALVMSDYLDDDGTQKVYFHEESGIGVTRRVIDMKIDDFLGLAEPLPQDDEQYHGDRKRRLKEFLRDVVDGVKFDWAIPTLTIKHTEDRNWKVIGHDGRHRAMLLKEIGFEEMPVCINFAKGDGFEDRWYIPYEDSDDWIEVVYAQNDKNVSNRRAKYPFPITKENCFSYYSRSEELHRELFEDGDEKCCATASDADILKHTAEIEREALKLAPTECMKAKKEFEKDEKKLTSIPVPPIEMKYANMQELLADRAKQAKKEKKD